LFSLLQAGTEFLRSRLHKLYHNAPQQQPGQRYAQVNVPVPDAVAHQPANAAQLLLGGLYSVFCQGLLHLRKQPLYFDDNLQKQNGAQ
jgi:hypothetical protein